MLAHRRIHHYGTLSRFSDPDRYAFAHGSKNGKSSFPVPTHVYDETISALKSSVEKAKMGETDRQKVIKKLTKLAQKAEENFTPNDNFEAVLQKERDDSWKCGGRTIKGYEKPPKSGQLGLFE